MGSLIAVELLANAKAVTQNTSAYSDSMDFSRCAGDAVVLVKTLLGTTTISQQVSTDNVNFYDPVNAAGTALGAVCTALAATTGTYISYTCVMAPYIRFKITETNVAALTITLRLAFREET